MGETERAPPLLLALLSRGSFSRLLFLSRAGEWGALSPGGLWVISGDLWLSVLAGVPGVRG